jgi:hypothetical protein
MTETISSAISSMVSRVTLSASVGLCAATSALSSSCQTGSSTCLPGPRASSGRRARSAPLPWRGRWARAPPPKRLRCSPLSMLRRRLSPTFSWYQTFDRASRASASGRAAGRVLARRGVANEHVAPFRVRGLSAHGSRAAARPSVLASGQFRPSPRGPASGARIVGQDAGAWFSGRSCRAGSAVPGPAKPSRPVSANSGSASCCDRRAAWTTRGSRAGGRRGVLLSAACVRSRGWMAVGPVVGIIETCGRIGAVPHWLAVRLPPLITGPSPVSAVIPAKV